MDDSVFNDYIGLLRGERHDFMNYLQIIMGYIQINHPEKAIEYIKNINVKMNELSKVYNIGSDYLSFLVQKCIADFEKEGIDTYFNSNIENIGKNNISKNIVPLKKAIGIATDDLINNITSKGNNEVYIDLFNTGCDIYIVLSESRKSIDKIDCSDGIQSEMNNACSLFKYEIDDSIIYKIDIKSR